MCTRIGLCLIVNDEIVGVGVWGHLSTRSNEIHIHFGLTTIYLQSIMRVNRVRPLLPRKCLLKSVFIRVYVLSAGHVRLYVSLNPCLYEYMSSLLDMFKAYSVFLVENYYPYFKQLFYFNC